MPATQPSSPPPAFTITAVTPTVTRAPNTRDIVTFTLTNTGSASDFRVFESCTGAATSCEGYVYVSALAMGASRTVEITYISGAPSSTGTIQVKAIKQGGLPSDTAVAVTTLTTSGVQGVTVTPTSATLSPQASVATTTTFSVKNTGSVSTTYTLAATCPTGPMSGIVTCSAPASVTVAGGATSVVTVSYTASATVGGTTPLSLKATAGDITASGTAMVTVAGTSGIAVDVQSVNSGANMVREQCLKIAAGHEGVIECGGDIRFTHPLQTVTSRSKSRTPVLLHSSHVAEPYVIVAANVTLPTVPTTVTATLTINGLTRATGSWTGSNWTAGSTRRIALGFDAVNDATGVYPYTLVVSNGTVNTTVTGTLLIVNRRKSAFGAGWWLAGLEQLQVLSNGDQLWIGGDGSARIYRTVTANSVWAADPLDRPDTIKKVGSIYTRYAENGVRVQFNTNGRHIYTINRLSDTTKFTYTADTLLTKITVPPTDTGASYTFSYTNPNGKLSSVVLTVAGGVTKTMTVYNPTGFTVRWFTDPDGFNVKYASYGTTALIQARGEKRGYVTNYGYTSTRRVALDTLYLRDVPFLGIINSYRHALLQGLSGTPAVPLDKVYTHHDGPRTDVGDTTNYYVNGLGTVTQVINALGDSTIIHRAHPTYPALATMVRQSNGLTTLAQYDTRGNITQSTTLNPLGNGLNAVTRYAWDPQWDFLTKQVNPEGDSVVIAYDATTGNRLWQQDGRGVTGRVTFGYYPSTASTARHLLAFVRSPLGLIDSVVYGATGNVSKVRSPGGVWTLRYEDKFGRTTSTRTPTNATQTTFQIDSMVYDVMDRVVQQRTIGDTDTALVLTQRDQGGLPIRVERKALPDRASLGTLVTQSRYDGANRLSASVAVDGNVDSTVYDPTGNVIKTISRLRDTITMTYDVLNRLTKRVTSNKFFWITTESNGSQYPRDAAYPGFFHIIPGDTATFTYDRAGNMTEAANYAAVTLRSYFPNGLIATDTQAIRRYPWSPMEWGDISYHRYGLSYTYDLNGRRTSFRPAYELAGNYTARTNYTYQTTTGWLTGVTDIPGNPSAGATFGFTYDVDGRPIKTTYPGGIRDSTVYNADGGVIRRLTYNTSTRGNGYSNATVLTDEAITRDVRGKISRVTIGGGLTPIDSLWMTYSTIGHLTGTNRRQPYSTGSGIQIRNESETFTLDGLANLTQFNTAWSEPGQSGWTNATYGYQAATGRMLSRGSETYAYDSAGNQVRAAASNSLGRMFYDALGKLRIADQRAGTWSDSLWHYDEFFYDALGRMVMTRSRANCSAVYNPGAYYPGGGSYYYVTDGRCQNKIRRTVWDGAQVSWELQYFGGTETGYPEDQDSGYDFDRPEVMGQANYLNVGPIDQPLAVWRSYYRSATAYQSPNPTLIVPHYNWRGVPIFPTFATGQIESCTTWGTYPPKCVAVSWPGMAQSYEKFVSMEVSWHGSFVDRSTQGSGLQYKRNRFYDPNTGRFTQEDPIGLAGGLNAYGFANGDPINFSDPFGLRPCSEIRRAMRRNVNDMERRIRQFREAAERGASTRGHLIRIEEARSRYGNLQEEYRRESCYDDDDHDDFRPWQKRGEIAQHAKLPSPQKNTTKAGKPIQLNFPEFKAPSAEEVGALGLGGGLLLLLGGLLLIPVGL